MNPLAGWLVPGETRRYEIVLHDFRGNGDGSAPNGNSIMDASGALFGTTFSGSKGPSCPQGCGTVFAIMP